MTWVVLSTDVVGQNFTNVKNMYTERLKSLKEAAKSGAAVPPAVVKAAPQNVRDDAHRMVQ